MFKTLLDAELTAALKTAKYKGPRLGQDAQCISNDKVYTGTMERFAQVLRQGKVVATVGFMRADGGAHTIRLPVGEFEVYERPSLAETAETAAELSALAAEQTELPPEPTAADTSHRIAKDTPVRIKRKDGTVQRGVVRGYTEDGKVRVTIGEERLKVKASNVMPVLPAAPKAKAAKPVTKPAAKAPAKAPKAAAKSTAKATAKPKTTTVKIKLGADVKARWAEDGKFYGAKVVGLMGTKAKVEWADGSGKATVLLTDVRAK